MTVTHQSRHSPKSEETTFYSFLHRNLPYFIIGAFALMIYFMAWLANNEIGIDTMILVARPGETLNWMDIERPAMVLLHKLFYANDKLSLFYCEGMCLVFSIAAMVEYAWLFYSKAKVACWQSLLFFLLVILHPLFTEQFYFTLQMADIAFGIFLCGLGLYFAWSKDYRYWILAIAILVFVFSIYQSFMPFYISLCLLLFCLAWMYERNIAIKKKHKSSTMSHQYFRLGLQQAILFIISFVLVRLMMKIFFRGESSYLYGQSNWGRESLTKIITIILNHRRIMWHHETIFYPQSLWWSFILLIPVVFWVCYKMRFRYGTLWFLLSLSLFEISTMLLTIYLGNYPTSRALLNVPIVGAGNLLLLIHFLYRFPKLFSFSKILLIGAIICVGLSLNEEYYVSTLMQYCAQEVKEDDARKVRQIEQSVLQVAGYTTKPVVFIGHPAQHRTNAMIELEIQTLGVFFPSVATEPRFWYLNDTLDDYMESLGIYFSRPDTVAQIQEARDEAQTMPIYPVEGSIRETNTLVVVKLGEDEWYSQDKDKPIVEVEN